MLNNQKENKEFLGKEEMGIAAASDEGIMPCVSTNANDEWKKTGRSIRLLIP